MEWSNYLSLKDPNHSIQRIFVHWIHDAYQIHYLLILSSDIITIFKKYEQFHSIGQKMNSSPSSSFSMFRTECSIFFSSHSPSNSRGPRMSLVHRLGTTGPCEPLCACTCSPACCEMLANL